MLANFMVRKYENWRKPHFSCVSLLILFLFSTLNVLTNGKSWNTTLINLVSNSFLLFCSSFEFLVNFKYLITILMYFKDYWFYWC
uniref:Uncharacterized protein n=1 Tax=Meloidogyne enterolobii TaxID=390850 RepID=A0A6V7UJ23_MELEN|nr:unnamed protein product [Meloidogyne enterolobii]